MSDTPRWQPPAMSDTAAKADDKRPTQVTVDEQMVRKMLVINPSMRAGRTTFQVKRDIENGGAVVPSAHPKDAPQVDDFEAAEENLSQTLDFFINTKLNKARTTLRDIEERRRALDAEAQNTKQGVINDLAQFLGLLDQAVVQQQGRQALAQHVQDFKAAGIELDINALLGRQTS